jgi:hypothetical protein
MMRYVFSICFLLAALSIPSFAHDSKGRLRANGYVFVAPGVRADRGTATIQIGGGGEAYVYKGLGLGFDGGVMMVTECEGCRGAVLSLNGIYSFKIASHLKINPFITGGASGMPTSDVPGGMNVGAGVQYWFHEKMGLRMEFRDHIFMGHWNHHYYQARIGFAFR